MTIVRQMPELYLRGSIANVTMKNLTQEEVEFCEEIAEWVANHEQMAKHRHQVAKVFSGTIGADYKEDYRASDQEYKIAVWRAIVNLFHHKHYKFQCEACGSVHRKVKGRPKPIDQLFDICPVCNKIKITDPGGTEYMEGDFVDVEEFQESYKYFTTNIPKCKSPIVALPGEQYKKEDLDEQLQNGEISQTQYERRLQQYRYDDPYSIINDPEQMTKFVGEFVWGYLKQQIRENKRREHHKAPTTIVGRADEVITKEIISICKKLNLPFTYCDDTQPEKGWWVIGINGLKTPPEFTAELIILLRKADHFGIMYDITKTSIKIKETLHAELIDASIINPKHVMVLDSTATINHDEDSNDPVVFQISFRTVGASKMELENHTAAVERSDVMQAVYSSLPDGNCKKIFELYSQDGELYREFRERYGYEGDKKPSHNDMADFLDVTPRTIKAHIENIRLMCLANQFTPSSISD